jgi:predicted transglutaminase-like cysteine proteinase
LRASLPIAVIVLAIGSVPLAAMSPKRVTTLGPALAPMGNVLFCERYPEDCEIKGSKKLVQMTEVRRKELKEINTKINNAISPEPDADREPIDQWTVNPLAGDCDDYAVTKRHELIKLGWPTSAVLLTEVRKPDGADHLLVVVRTSAGDFVLDNLQPTVRRLTQAKSDYQWVRMQSENDPRSWNIARVEG